MYQAINLYSSLGSLMLCLASFERMKQETSMCSPTSSHTGSKTSKRMRNPEFLILKILNYNNNPIIITKTRNLLAGELLSREGPGGVD